MSISLSRQTAQKIVDTVKDVCGFDINFINPKGIIFASTDEVRVGTYHEIGRKVIETGKTIEVESDNSFHGTHKGVNIPFVYNRELIAAIGISGNPDEVRPFAILAEKITTLILKEQEIDFINYSRKNQINYIIRSIIENAAISHGYLVEFLNGFHMTPDTLCRTILIKPHSKCKPSSLTLIEDQIYKVFEQAGAQLYTFHFPNEYLAILPDKQFQNKTYLFETLAGKYEKTLSVGVGNCCALNKQHESYGSAKIAVQSLTADSNIAFFDNLDLEILLGNVSESAQKRYLQKTTGSLSMEDIEILKVYYSTNMSLKETAKQLFIHKNTLQYKLNRIGKLSGYNPRLFRDAVSLYLATMLDK